jgi:hypothetical protein
MGKLIQIKALPGGEIKITIKSKIKIGRKQQPGASFAIPRLTMYEKIHAFAGFAVLFNPACSGRWIHRRQSPS